MGNRLLSVALCSGMIIAAASFGARPAFSQDDDIDANEAVRAFEVLPDLANPEDAFQRTRAVLEHFGVPDESDPQSELNALSGRQSAAGLRALLKYFDPRSEFADYAELSSGEVRFYQDRQGFEVPGFSATLRKVSSASAGRPALGSVAARLITAKAGPREKPLLGLRIALDPGHMGGGTWDAISGKWVRDARTGRVLSEGVLNLQTALLLEQSLTRLGAQVMVTRHDLAPVSSADFYHFDIEESERREFRESSLLSWFQDLIAANPVGQHLYDSFLDDPSFKNVFSAGSADNRWDDYNAVDLQARVDAIEAFRPDITLIIHYDSSCPADDPHGLNPGPAGAADSTKVYVAGAFSSTEFASRDDRAQFAMHLLDPQAWKISVALAHEVVTSLSENLGIPFDRESPGLTRVVEPGVFSRNLYLLRAYQGSATAYAEGLFYNDPGEFDAFYDATHPMVIDGQDYPYSDRLAEVADAYKQAIVNFVDSFRASFHS